MTPDTDGVDHINIYTKGKTEVGRALTNLSPYSFLYEGDRFMSVEGFWYYHKMKILGLPYEHFKVMRGFDAKKAGGKIKHNLSPEQFDEFKLIMIEGMKCRLRQNPKLLKLLVDSDLPFKHYYGYGSTEKGWKIVELHRHNWQCDLYEEIRSICKKAWRDDEVKD